MTKTVIPYYQNRRGIVTPTPRPAAAAAAAFPDIITDDLLLWWKCDDGSGAALADSVGTKDATLAGTEAQLWANTAPGGGPIVSFDGVNDQGYYTYTGGPVGDFVLQFWVWLQVDITGTDNIISRYGMGGPNGRLNVGDGAGAGVEGAWGRAQPDGGCVYNWPQGTWMMVTVLLKAAAVYTADYLRLYINTALTDTKQGINVAANSVLWVGSQGGANFCQCRIGDVAMYGGFVGGIPAAWWDGANITTNYDARKARYGL